MVVCLEGRAELALGENDQCVDDLVELAEVEDPAVESKALVPQTAKIRGARGTMGSQNCARRGGLPCAGCLVIDDSISQAPRSIEFANRVDEAREPGGAKGVHHGATEGAEHTDKGPC